ncbi:MAG: UDP-N-acetylmuramate dehydrogenase [Firmicutes bacterium]|nr:UDP-N-acetylmuramate dehydrogenase [Bacillota bacterium]
MYSGLYKLLPPQVISRNEPMKNHTTFRIGGPVDILVSPRSLAEIKLTINYCRQHEIPLLIFGRGSNILVRDKGIRGVAINIGHNLQAMQVEGEQIYAQAGISLGLLAQQAAACALSGLEFAEGIPGSLGGAIVMNAGAYAGEMQGVVLEVETLSPAGQEHIFRGEEIGFNYRSSVFQHNGFIIVAARLQLKKGNQESIQLQMRAYARSRREKQPLEYPSAGSVFKRPPGFYVGPMIEELGLKGCRIGGAEVSSKHAGFIVNSGSATASDVLELIATIKRAAWGKYGVELQPEIKVIGEE